MSGGEDGRLVEAIASSPVVPRIVPHWRRTSQAIIQRKRGAEEQQRQQHRQRQYSIVFNK